MGAAAAPVASISSLASIGFALQGSKLKSQADLMQAQGTNAADQMQAAQAEQAAQFARLNADLADTTAREKLNRTISNIDAIRATAGVDPRSPTTGVVEGYETMVSDRARIATDVTLRTQAATDEASAQYLRESGAFALAQGQVASNADIIGGYATAFGSLAKGISSFGLGK